MRETGAPMPAKATRFRVTLEWTDSGPSQAQERVLRALGPFRLANRGFKDAECVFGAIDEEPRVIARTDSTVLNEQDRAALGRIIMEQRAHER